MTKQGLAANLRRDARARRRSILRSENIPAESEVVQTENVTQRKEKGKEKEKEKEKKRVTRMVMEEEEKEEEEEEWPPRWKSIEESRQYQNGMITRLLTHRWEPEDFRQCENHNFNLRRFLNQVRETRGYEVDAGAPDLVGSPFNHLYDEAKIKDYLKNCPHFKKSFPKEMKSVIAQINAQAETHGKRYELQKVERMVQVTAHRCDLITFRVKEFDLDQKVALKKKQNAYVVKTIQAMVYIRPGNGLIEWRFKPE